MSCKSRGCGRVPELLPGYCEGCIISRKKSTCKRAEKNKAKRAEDKVLRQGAPKKTKIASSSTMANNDDSDQTKIASSSTMANNDDSDQTKNDDSDNDTAKHLLIALNNVQKKHWWFSEY